MPLRSLLSHDRRRPGRAGARPRRRQRVRLLLAAAVPDRGAGRSRRAARSRAVGGRRRRSRRARPGGRPACVAGAAARALLPDARRHLRVAPDAAAAPRRAAHGGARFAAGRGETRRRRDAGRPVVVVSAVALSEKVPDPALRPHSFTLRVGELLDLDECAGELVAAGYERVDQVEERGQFAMRGGLLDVFPATEESAVRVDMFDVEIESLRWFSTFTQRSLGRRAGGRDRAGGRACRRAPRAGRGGRRASLPRPSRGPRRARRRERRGRTSPSYCRSIVSARCSTWSARRRSWWWRPRRSSHRR